MLRLTVSSILRREKELIRFGSSLAISQRGLTDGMHQAEGTRSPAAVGSGAESIYAAEVSGSRNESMIAAILKVTRACDGKRVDVFSPVKKLCSHPQLLEEPRQSSEECQDVEFRADSVRRKRKKKMNKHKHAKRRKLNRHRK